jgi:hypothetical protein
VALTHTPLQEARKSAGPDLGGKASAFTDRRHLVRAPWVTRDCSWNRVDVDGYRTYDAMGLAELVRSGEVKPEELFEAARTRADRRPDI